MKAWILFLVELLLLGIGSTNALSQAQLPVSTRTFLKELKLPSSFLAGTDKELDVPKTWIEGARKEGRVTILSTWEPSEAEKLLRPFRERYSFIKIEHNSSGALPVRGVKTLTSFQQGIYVTDIVYFISGVLPRFFKANALEDLTGLPNWNRIPVENKDPMGRWVGVSLIHAGIGYNTKLVRGKDLPRRWEDLFVDTRFKDGNLALGNRPQNWALMLWDAWGEEKTEQFLTRFFRELKPQTRSEGLSALVDLLAAGEYHWAIPSLSYRVEQGRVNGAPIDWFSPEPIPTYPTDISILRNTPHVNSARLFINWLLSKEGQLSLYIATMSVPVRQEFQRKEFVPFFDRIEGKKPAFRGPSSLEDNLPKLLKFWQGLWLGK